MQLQQLIETKTLAAQLLREFGLTEQGWKFEFSNKKNFVGTCYHQRKLIEVSKYYLDSHPDEIEDTLRHEIAHALVGHGHGHDHVWRRKCIEVGANPSRTTDRAVYSGDYNYAVGCDNEGCDHQWESGRHRLKKAIYRYHCKYCKGPMFVRNNKTGEVTYTTPDKSWAEV